MLLLLPLLSLYAWLRIFRFYVARWRARLLFAAVWWTLSLILITELLSAFGAIRQNTLAIAWAITTAFLFFVDFLQSFRHDRLGVPAVRRAGHSAQAVEPKHWFLLTSCMVLLAGTGVTALVAPPNGWDETLQHLPRVMQWIAQGSIRLFPTNYYVQDFAPPLTEWTMMHLLLLAGPDRCVNLVQWFGSLGSALAVSLIAEEFGCTLRGQLVAALLCLTLPQGVLGASGAKNDWLVAFWLAVAVFLILRWQRDRSWLTVCTLGIALGALLLTKGSAYVFGPPVAVALLFVTPPAARRKLATACLLAATIMALLNAPHWAQNYRLGHSIVGLPTPDVEGKLKYTADRVTMATAAANILRETSIHFGTPLSSVNQRSTALVRKAIHALGVDPDDPALIRPGPAFAIPTYSLDEYLAGNPLHLLLAVFCFAVVIFSLWRMPQEAALAVGIVVAFVLYCSLFKWELWAGRLHLGLFVLACPIIAVVLCQTYPKITTLIVLVLLVAAIPPLLFNSIRPLASSNIFRTLLHRPPDPTANSIFFRNRDAMYFAESADLESSYLPAGVAARRIDCDHIGIDNTNRPFSYEYILMGIIDDQGTLRDFRYVGVTNLTTKFPSRIDQQPPCMVLCIHCLQDSEKMTKYSAAFTNVQHFGSVTLFSQPRR